MNHNQTHRARPRFVPVNEPITRNEDDDEDENLVETARF
jgi:hypothetical protein